MSEEDFLDTLAEEWYSKPMSKDAADRRSRPHNTQVVTGERIRSIRGYRRRLDSLTAQAMRGEIPWGDVRSAAAAIKAGAELMMSEHLLKHTSDGDTELGEHPLGDYGGLTESQKAKLHKKKKVKVKSGVDKRGHKIDEVSVEVETSFDDDEALSKAQIETLM